MCSVYATWDVAEVNMGHCLEDIISCKSRLGYLHWYTSLLVLAPYGFEGVSVIGTEPPPYFQITIADEVQETAFCPQLSLRA